MTTELDTELRAAVLEIANDLGAAATYIVVDDSYNPASADVDRRTASHTIKITPPSTPKEFVEGEMVERRDLETLIAASGTTFTPKPGDKLVFQSVTYAVITASPIMSGDLPCAYTLRLRR